MVTYLRDDFKDLPFAACWDLAGGGAEAGESPVDCALRETHEEFGLRLSPDRIIWQRAYPSVLNAPLEDWFMVAHLTAQEVRSIELGDEGQFWQLMRCAEFCVHPKGITHLQARLNEYLKNNEG